eukprot:jgi/Mesen1/2719/ME000168S01793
MVATATFVGAGLGLCVQLYSNAVRKLPAMRHPWEHVLGMGIGAYLANGLVEWEESAAQKLEAQIESTKAANMRRKFKDTMRQDE